MEAGTYDADPQYVMVHANVLCIKLLQAAKARRVYHGSFEAAQEYAESLGKGRRHGCCYCRSCVEGVGFNRYPKR